MKKPQYTGRAIVQRSSRVLFIHLSGHRPSSYAQQQLGSLRMGHQHVKHYSSSDSEPEAPSTPPPRQRRQRRSTKGSLIPYSQSVSSSSPSSSTTTTDDKKKKERKKKDLQKPPQERINSIWERFSQKKFSKALAVLPFAPVQASSAGDRGNELLEAGYERAAEECRRKVRKIISECRRINTRYRDPSFDLVSGRSCLVNCFGSRDSKC